MKRRQFITLLGGAAAWPPLCSRAASGARTAFLLAVGGILAPIEANDPSEIAGLDDDSHYRDRLARCSSDFRLLRDIAKAQKHVHLGRGKPLVTTSAQVTARSIGWDEARWDEGRWGGPPQVVVTTDNGELRYVEQIVAAALELLKTEMTRLGI